ncbi:MAG: ATP-binding protein [Deltaproteobacteria bacterium]
MALERDAETGGLATTPRLDEHIDRILGLLRGCGLLLYPHANTPLRRKLADFMDQQRDETVRRWIETVGTAFAIEDKELTELIEDIRDAQTRWIARIRNPEDTTTYAVLREHARGGFISKHPASRFLASQLLVQQITADLLRRERPDDPDLPNLLGLLEQEHRERTLHITDFFVEARERDLADHAEGHRRSLDMAPAAMFTVDSDDGIILAANLFGRSEVGSKDRELAGTALWDLHPPRERDQVRQTFHLALRDGAASLENLHLEREGRSPLPVDLRATLIEYHDERILQAMYVDLSERRRLEFQLIQSEKMAAIGQLAAGIAHEIRNPLGIITNALYDLGELLPEAPAEVEEDLRIARSEMARVQEIINNLLEFSRDSRTETQSVDLGTLVERTLRLMNKYLQNNGVRARTMLAESALCEANENGMRQVLLNLITNAVQAMPEGGDLCIATEITPGGRIELSISDTGTGVPPERLGNIFDPFFTTKEPGEGTGLGLSVVHSVITSCGGTIDVSSRPGGTTFTIRLPPPATAVALPPASEKSP